MIRLGSANPYITGTEFVALSALALFCQSGFANIRLRSDRACAGESFTSSVSIR